MISDELKKSIDNLKEQGKMRFLEGATEEQIAQFEKEHDLNLPEQFKEWLQYSDGGDCFLPAGVQFYGVAHNPLIDVDRSDRPDENYIVIGALDTGDPILYKKGESRISIYNQEAGIIENDEIYEDFLAFLKDLPEILGIEG
jgi:hypothetical protein